MLINTIPSKAINSKEIMLNPIFITKIVHHLKNLLIALQFITVNIYTLNVFIEFYRTMNLYLFVGSCTT
jgi:hypothetical protein